MILLSNFKLEPRLKAFLAVGKWRTAFGKISNRRYYVSIIHVQKEYSVIFSVKYIYYWLHWIKIKKIEFNECSLYYLFSHISKCIHNLSHEIIISNLKKNMIIWDKKSKFYNLEDLWTVKQGIVDYCQFSFAYSFFFKRKFHDDSCPWLTPSVKNNRHY